MDRRIPQDEYDEQLEAINQKLLFANGALRDAQIDKSELGTLFTFAERALTEVSRMWLDASIGRKLTIQKIVLPDGLSDEPERGLGGSRNRLHFIDLGRA